MPSNISFFLTTQQFLDGSKDVTRRDGWKRLKAGDVLMAVEKSHGLGKGDKIKQLGLIRIVSARREPVSDMIDNRWYGYSETVREGFPNMTPEQFVVMFCEQHKGVIPSTTITRIEFKRL